MVKTFLLYNKKHKHNCHQCKNKVNCDVLHSNDKDLTGTLCDLCVKRILKNLKDMSL